MALYPNAADPGNWQSFVLREDVKTLPVSEQRKKYLTEQLQFEDFMAQQRYLQSMSINSLTNQLHQGGGFATNPVLSANFNGTIQAITGNTTQIDLVFNEAVTINTAGGTPYIDVPNNQAGGGVTTPVRYTYYESSGNTNMRFQHVHPANAGGVAAAALTSTTSLESSISSTTLSGATGGVQTGVTFTYAQGTGVSGGGANISCDIIVSGGGTTLDEITIDGTIPSGLYYPGNTFTANAAAIGAGGTGQVVVTLVAGDLQGDVLTLVGTDVTLNGGYIYSTENGPSYPLDPEYTSTDTTTVSAT
jgi:hypothetical protein